MKSAKRTKVSRQERFSDDDDDDYQEKSLKKFKEQFEIVEDVLEREIEEEEEEENLDKWKIKQMRAVAVRQLKRLEQNKVSISPKIMKPYANEVIHFADLESIDESFMKILPRSTDEEWQKFEERIEQQKKQRSKFTDHLFCPKSGCEFSSKDTEKIKLHYERIHLKLKRFGCVCGLKYSDIRELRNHIDTVHKGIEFKCDVCERLYSSPAHLLQHEENGHVVPTGNQVFWSPASRKIGKKMFEMNDLKRDVASMGSFQLVAIPWFDEKDVLIDVSIEVTSYEDPVQYAKTYWNCLKRYCERLKKSINSNDVDDPLKSRDDWVFCCGHARKMTEKGYKIIPERSFSLQIYGISLVVICNLKWWTRMYVDAPRVHSTEESKAFLAPYSSDLKKHLAPFIRKMASKNQHFVRDNGAKF